MPRIKPGVVGWHTSAVTKGREMLGVEPGLIGWQTSPLTTEPFQESNLGGRGLVNIDK